MQDVLLTIEGVSVYTLSAFVFLAFLWSGFVFYKKAIEYHEEEDVVFNTILLMGVLSFVFSRVWFVLGNLDIFTGHWIRVLFMREYPGMSGWGVMLGVFLGVLLSYKRNKEDIFNLMDLSSLGLSAGLPIVFAAKGALSSGPMLAGVMSFGVLKGLLLALWFFFLWWAEGEYRTFEWYRFRKTQARTGFVTGVFVFGFGLINLLVEMLHKDSSLWYVYLGLVVVGALVVYIRSERRVKKDLKLFLKSLKRLSVKKKSIKWPRIKRKK